MMPPEEVICHTWMGFVDGENLVMRAQELHEAGAATDPQLVEGPNYRKNTFVWLPGRHAMTRIPPLGSMLKFKSLRCSYYTSLCGDSVAIEEVRRQLWGLGFDPYVFKKSKQQAKAKGVDIALTKDMLAHGFRGNYDAAVLVAGDGDYIPLVEEVKRLGKPVHLWFFRAGLNPELKLACDDFFDLTEVFVERWRSKPLAGAGRSAKFDDA